MVFVVFILIALTAPVWVLFFILYGIYALIKEIFNGVNQSR